MYEIHCHENDTGFDYALKQVPTELGAKRIVNRLKKDFRLNLNSTCSNNEYYYYIEVK